MANFDEIATMDAMMQSAVIELIQKDALLNPNNKVPPILQRTVFDSSQNTFV